ncbi:MAG: hypothetical protein ABI640_13040 [Gammaproteobacteria bacterium]
MKKLLTFVLLFAAFPALAAHYITRPYGVATTIDFDLYTTTGVDKKTDAACATGDVIVMKDEGSPGNATNCFTDEGTEYALALTSTEMTAARIAVNITDQSTKVWLDDTIVIETYGNPSSQHPDPAGRLITSGTAQAGSATSITLAAGTSSFADDTLGLVPYGGATVYILRGTGAGQVRSITGWVSATQVANVNAPWVTTPDSTSVYEVHRALQAYLAVNSNGRPQTDVREINGNTAAVDNSEAFFEGAPVAQSGDTFPLVAVQATALLNCTVNTANYAGDTTHMACILTDIDGGAVTQATGGLTGLQIVVTSGALAREQRFIRSTTWDGANSELRLTLDRALPAILADAVTVVIR